MESILVSTRLPFLLQLEVFFVVLLLFTFYLLFLHIDHSLNNGLLFVLALDLLMEEVALQQPLLFDGNVFVLLYQTVSGGHRHQSFEHWRGRVFELVFGFAVGILVDGLLYLLGHLA